MKKRNPYLDLPKETDCVSVNQMKIVNGSADKDRIRTSVGGLPASEIEHRLHITPPWFLAMTECIDDESSESNPFLGEIVFHVDFIGRFHPCPECGRMCPVNDREDRTYYHTVTFDCKTAIRAKVPKLHCPVHGYPQMRVPWARPRASYTLFLERKVLIEIREERSINAVSRTTGASQSIIDAILDYRIKITLERMDLSHVHTIFIDETSWKKGHKYVTLVYDQFRNLIYICEGKNKDTVKEFKKWLKGHNGSAENIMNVSCDMGEAYPSGVRDNFPNAVITFDKFHVIKLVTEAFDELMKRQDQENKQIKWFRRKAFHSRDLTEQDEKRLDSIMHDYREIGHNYRLLMVICKIYDYPDKEMASHYFDIWYRAVQSFGSPEMKTAAESLNKRKDDILRWYDSRINNGIVEGMNSQFKLLIRRARGYKNVNRLINMAYLLFSNQPLFYEDWELECLNLKMDIDSSKESMSSTEGGTCPTFGGCELASSTGSEADCAPPPFRT